MARQVWGHVEGGNQECRAVERGHKDQEGSRQTDDCCYWAYCGAGSIESFATILGELWQVSDWATVEKGQIIQAQKESVFQDSHGRWAPANNDHGRVISEPSEHAKKLTHQPESEASQDETIRSLLGKKSDEQVFDTGHTIAQLVEDTKEAGQQL